MKNIVVEKLKIQFPIIQSPMAGVSTPPLIAAAANAGVLASLAAGYMSPLKIKDEIAAIRKLTDKHFAVNLFIPEKHFASKLQIEAARKLIKEVASHLQMDFPDLHEPYAPNFEEQLEVLLDEQISIFSFTFGIPDAKILERVRKHNIVTIGTATNLVEAQLLEQHGIDFIVAQGKEAGGHRGTFLTSVDEGLIPLLDLIPHLITRVKTPIIAAGGIMTANDIATVMHAGAHAAQMGTAFLCCTEAATHPAYKNILLDSNDDLTVLTRAFSGKTARGIKNKFIEVMQKHENLILDYPIQNALTLPMRKVAQEKNNTDFMSMWAGCGMRFCSQLRVEELIKELTGQLLAR